MGSGYTVKCPNCGHEFDHYYGVGMDGESVIGSTANATDSFCCPKCDQKFDPTELKFYSYLTSLFDWD
jgi:endogenous inhibitor of DNA gyrase (YacG/DUF329 family)